MEVNRFVRIELQRKANGEPVLVGWYQHGDHNTVLGTTPTERGARRMLTVYAKRFGLVVSGDIATKVAQ